MRRIQIAKNSGGWFALIPLPNHRGLNIGTGMTGLVSVRPWYWALLDHIDHIPDGFNDDTRATLVAAHEQHTQREAKK